MQPLTDSDQSYPTKPAGFSEARWLALCEWVRLAATIERLETEGGAEAPIIAQRSEVAAKATRFLKTERVLAEKLISEFDRARALERQLDHEFERAIRGGSIGRLMLPGIRWPETMGRGYLRESQSLDKETLPLDEPQFLPTKAQTYYIFIEEVALPDMAAAVDGPDGVDIDRARHRVFSETPIRFRGSGLQYDDFHRVEGNFEILDPENIDRNQRNRRRRDIEEHLDGIHLPIVDLFMASHHPDLRAVRMMLSIGSWHMIGVSREPVIHPECPVMIGAPEIAEDPYGFAYLAYLGPVPAHIEVRLRDIFSLAHIPDARFDTEREEEGGGRPLPPPDGPPEEQWVKAEAAPEASMEQGLAEENSAVTRRYTPPPMLEN